MKNKFIGLIVILGLISAYPMWRYFSNAKLFAEVVLSHVNNLGEWSHGAISSGFDGTITIRNLSFTPENYTQGFDIQNVVIKTSPMFLLKTQTEKLRYLLPDTLSISVNSAQLNTKSEDFSQALRQKSLWMFVAGYAGSFGCTRDSFTSFDESSWQNILEDEQVFNVDFFYSKQLNGNFDVDLILDAENLFSSTWSTNFSSGYSNNQISLEDLVVDKLYYYYLDNGFNLKRNQACMKNYKSSFAAYRLSSAEHVQNYLRTNYRKELPKVLINWYQRMLAPDVEYSAIISLDQRRYLSDVYKADQLDIYENSVVEVATTENNYLPVSLKEIDFTKIDSELLKKENAKRKERERLAKLQKDKQKSVVKQPKIFTTGVKESRLVALNNLSSAFDKKVRVKTTKGRPITGYIRSIDKGLIVIETIFRKGKATLRIPVENVASVEYVK